MSTIIETIIEQMGGLGRIRAMIGGRVLTDAANNGIHIRFSNRRGPNVVKVYYDAGRDLYNVEFGRVHGKYRVLETFDGVYGDQLIPLFEEETGLYLRF